MGISFRTEIRGGDFFSTEPRGGGLLGKHNRWGLPIMGRWMEVLQDRGELSILGYRARGGGLLGNKHSSRWRLPILGGGMVVLQDRSG